LPFAGGLVRGGLKAGDDGGDLRLGNGVVAHHALCVARISRSGCPEGVMTPTLPAAG
jgi:hypothetical protein